jgi:NTP pyrophosphatase (non-canonical NTP hydrolase)
MNDLVKLVQQWSINKGLDEADSRGQFLKIVEEVGEVAAALARSDVDNLKEEIGDVVVTLIVYAQQNGVDISIDMEDLTFSDRDSMWHILRVINGVRNLGGCYQSGISHFISEIIGDLTSLSLSNKLNIGECLQAAYTKISGRTGKMVNGIFVKDGDIKTPYDPNIWPKNKRDSEGDSDYQNELKI